MTSESRTVGASPVATAREEPRSKRRRLVDEVTGNESDSHVQDSNPANLRENDNDNNVEAEETKQRPILTSQSMDDRPELVTTQQQLPKQQPSSASLSSSRRIFIGNLHPRVSKAHLEKLLQPYWSSSSSSSSTTTIMDIRLCFHPNGQPRGFAFCEFPTSHDAQAAIHALHGRTLLSRTLIVQEASPAGNNTKNNMTTTSHNQYYNHAGRGGTRDSAGASVTTPRREMKREEINDKIAKLKRALQENNNNP
jgi:RNA recognition motif-containing protein